MSHEWKHRCFQLGTVFLLLGFAGVTASWLYAWAFWVGLVALVAGIALIAIGHEEKEKRIEPETLEYELE
jgi:protein-S-isoprenylcysteine O-methyltransferase Ste14